MTSPRDTEGGRPICPACGADLGHVDRDEPRSCLVCRTPCARARRADHRHFVFDHREVTDLRAEGVLRSAHIEQVWILADGVELGGTLGRPSSRAACDLRARQRERPAQSTERSGGARLEPRGTRDPAVRPPQRRGGGRSTARVRRAVARRSPGRGHRVGGAGPPRANCPDRLLRGEHGVGRGVVGRRRAVAPRAWACVSRGGRPDLVDARLERVEAPTLLIVGGHDKEVLALNRAPAGRMVCEHRLEVIAGATHLFEEPGALERVGHLRRRGSFATCPSASTQRRAVTT